MPRLTHINPAYRRHRASGQAVVSIAGRDHYLGPWKSKASMAEYDRVIGEWLANGRRPSVSEISDITVGEIIDRFWQHAKSYYRHPDGTPTSEVTNLKSPLGILNRLYGATPATAFGPLALESVRMQMVSAGWCRKNVNRQVDRIKLVFR